MLRRQSIFRRMKVTYLYVTVFKCVCGLLGFSGDGNFLISKGFRCYKSKWYIISLPLSSSQSFEQSFVGAGAN